jgi:hypothetical protein
MEVVDTSRAITANAGSDKPVDGTLRSTETRQRRQGAGGRGGCGFILTCLGSFGNKSLFLSQVECLLEDILGRPSELGKGTGLSR